MQNLKITITAGIAMFAMFFGSGNLVFPLELGVISGDQYFISSIGFILTGVLVPFMGLISMMLYDGDRKKYFGHLGAIPAFVLTIIMLSLMGPFGVLPRCILVAYGSIKAIYPSLSLALFSIIFCALIAAIVWEKNSFIPIIGKLLGPVKILVIGLIILVGVIYAPSSMMHHENLAPFSQGILYGYQTMDLPASFFFAVTIMDYLKKAETKEASQLKLGIHASIIGGGLIAIIYFLFSNMGAHYATYLSDSNPEEYLAAITDIALGRGAAIIFAIMMFFACITTASTLCKLFSELLKHDMSNEKLSWHQSVIVTLAISFTLSLTGFSTISSFLGVILKHVYPALIMLTLALIWNRYRPFAYVKHIFWATLIYEIIKQNIL